MFQIELPKPVFEKLRSDYESEAEYLDDFLSYCRASAEWQRWKEHEDYEEALGKVY